MVIYKVYMTYFSFRSHFCIYACSVFASQVHLRIMCVCVTLPARDAECRGCRHGKCIFLCDVTTEVLVKWSIMVQAMHASRCMDDHCISYGTNNCTLQNLLKEAHQELKKTTRYIINAISVSIILDFKK